MKQKMKYMDIDCYERGCACASSNRVAGQDSEVVEIVKFKELSDEEIMKMAAFKFHRSEYWLVIDFAKELLKKASQE
jgi:hypothetical protein